MVSGARQVTEIAEKEKRKWIRTKVEQNRNLFIMSRNRFRTATRAAKRAAWSEQIEQAELENPWGRVYRIVRRKLSPPSC